MTAAIDHQFQRGVQVLVDGFDNRKVVGESWSAEDHLEGGKRRVQGQTMVCNLDMNNLTQIFVDSYVLFRPTIKMLCPNGGETHDSILSTTGMTSLSNDFKIRPSRGVMLQRRIPTSQANQPIELT